MTDRERVLAFFHHEMTDELGRKVDVEEVAGRMGLTEDEIRDILKLAGEEPEDGQ